MADIQEKVIIIGGGPAGLTAAIYAGRAELAPLVACGSVDGTNMPGGQLMITSEVENYPGFPEGVQGPDMMEKFQQQAERFGAKLEWEFATEFDLKEGGPFRVKIDNKWYSCETLILANGASARWLGAKDEDKFVNKGISACATCDGPLPLFKNKVIFVIGAGDSACEEALFLTRFASKVIMICRREQMRASRIMQKRVLDHEKIEVMWNSVVDTYKGGDLLSHVVVKNVKSGEVTEHEAAGCFMAIGHEPNTKYLKGSAIKLDDAGYIEVNKDVYTNIDGVFAAGDCHDTIYRQAVTASGFGCMAAITAERWLEEKNAKL